MPVRRPTNGLARETNSGKTPRSGEVVVGKGVPPKPRCPAPRLAGVEHRPGVALAWRAPRHRSDPIPRRRCSTARPVRRCRYRRSRSRTPSPWSAADANSNTGRSPNPAVPFGGALPRWRMATKAFAVATSSPGSASMACRIAGSRSSAKATPIARRGRQRQKCDIVERQFVRRSRVGPRPCVRPPEDRVPSTRLSASHSRRSSPRGLAVQEHVYTVPRPRRRGCRKSGSEGRRGPSFRCRRVDAEPRDALIRSAFGIVDCAADAACRPAGPRAR